MVLLIAKPAKMLSSPSAETPQWQIACPGASGSLSKHAACSKKYFNSTTRYIFIKHLLFQL